MAFKTKKQMNEFYANDAQAKENDRKKKIDAALFAKTGLLVSDLSEALWLRLEPKVADMVKKQVAKSRKEK